MAPAHWLDPQASDYIWSLSIDGGLDGRSRVFLGWLSRHIETCSGPDELIRLGCLILAIEKEISTLLIATLDKDLKGQALTDFLTQTGAPYIVVYREGCLIRDKACRSAVGHIASIMRNAQTHDELAGLIGTMSIVGRIVRELGITMRNRADGPSRS